MTLPTGTKALRTIVADLNGQARGKRLPAHAAQKLTDDGARMPLSALNVDIAGNDIENSPLVFAAGDADGALRPTGRGFVPAPWLDTPTALLPMWMFHDNGAPFDGDPRQALARVLERYEAKGWTPIVATEIEFCLIDDSKDTPQPAASPRSGKVRIGSDILSSRALDGFDRFFTDLYDGAAAMDLPADAAIAEAGLGQFEVNLLHGPAMKAADDAWLFKLLIQGMGRKHGFAASFLPKPYPDHAGNGLHLHVSILDETGRNVFDDGSDAGSAFLLSAVAGCLQAMSDSTLVFAPHGPSYDRFVSHAHAPTHVGWGYENRTAAIRIPGGSPKARRIEHRVAGADVNPYLLISAVLGAALDGIERAANPGSFVTGNAYEADLPQIPTQWDQSIQAFKNSEILPRFLPRELIGNYVLTKEQEHAAFAELSVDERLALYIDLA